MDMPTVVAVWNKREWSTNAIYKETESVDKETEAGNDHYFGYYDWCCGCCAVARK
ncbi:hypothetical protein A2U01_0061990 [Trifolium medium]|uniref:Uncharacterized protein n=1 Tax=Trifolium medium TaxID=97028 RepID=A0A392RX67_9FABA|nr:hypothetical protein [Trifolium medium]